MILATIFDRHINVEIPTSSPVVYRLSVHLQDQHNLTHLSNDSDSNNILSKNNERQQLKARNS